MYYFNSEKYHSKLLNLEIFDKGRNSIFKNNHSPRLIFFSDIWDKVFKSIQKFVEDGFQKIWSDITSNFLKAVFHKFYLVHSWISWLKSPIKALKSLFNVCLTFYNSLRSKREFCIWYVKDNPEVVFIPEYNLIFSQYFDASACQRNSDIKF